MEFVNFGAAGVKVSKIALGLGFREQDSRQEAERVIEHAIYQGINFIDCSNFYNVGENLSEEILSGILKSHRDDLVITSKVFSDVGNGPNDSGNSRYHIMREIDKTLSRLKTDHIDVYILHGYDYKTPLEETLRALDDLVTSGKIRYAGCSNFSAWQVCKALWIADKLNLDRFICVQNPYSLLNRTIENELFGLIRDQELGMMAFSPIGAGLLSGSYKAGQPPPPNSPWATKDRTRYNKSMSGSTPAILSELKTISENRNKSVAQVALQWVLSKNEVTVAITGSDTTEQLDENIGAIGWELTTDEISVLDNTSLGSNINFVSLV